MGAVDGLHDDVVREVGAQFVGEGAQGVGELAGEVGGVGDLLEVDEHVPQVLLAHGFEDGQVQGGGAARGGPGFRIGERVVQFSVGDGGDDELVVGEDAVIDGVGVGVGVQAGAEDLRLVHGRQQGWVVPGGCGGGGALGLRSGGGRLGQAGGVPHIGGGGEVEAALGMDALVVVQRSPVLLPGAGRGVGFVHDQQAEEGGGEDRGVLSLFDLGQRVVGEEDRRFGVAAEPVGQVLPRVGRVDLGLGEQRVGGGA